MLSPWSPNCLYSRSPLRFGSGAIARSLLLSLALAPLACLLRPPLTVAQVVAPETKPERTCRSLACQSLLELEAAIDPAIDPEGEPTPNPAIPNPALEVAPGAGPTAPIPDPILDAAPSSADDRPRSTLPTLLPEPDPSSACTAPLAPDLGQPFAAAFAHSYAHRQAFVPSPGAIAALVDLPTAYCQQRQTITALTPLLGSPIGYKVAATSEPVQQFLGVSQPLVGRLFSTQLLPNGVTISLASGARLIYEADLLVQVGDVAINEAVTLEEVAESLELVVPFVEVADLTVAEGVALTGPLLAAINGGSRWGVLGRGTAVTEAGALVRSLAQLQVKLGAGVGAEEDRSGGQAQVEAPGTAILGHPLRSVLVLRDHLQSQGQRLEPGDWISLGSFGRFLPAEVGIQAEAQYLGFPGGDQRVQVRFVP